MRKCSCRSYYGEKNILVVIKIAFGLKQTNLGK